MTDCFIPVPIYILDKLKTLGDCHVVYSTFGNLCELSSFNKSSGITIRTDKSIIEQTIIGVKLGRSYVEFIDSKSYEITRTYSDINLGIIKLPKELLDDNLILFKAPYENHPEILYFNNLKIKFNKDGTFIL
jgi:hypothetical protein